MIRSASPSFWVRSTMPSSRNRLMGPLSRTAGRDRTPVRLCASRRPWGALGGRAGGRGEQAGGVVGRRAAGRRPPWPGLALGRAVGAVRQRDPGALEQDRLAARGGQVGGERLQGLVQLDGERRAAGVGRRVGPTPARCRRRAPRPGAAAGPRCSRRSPAARTAPTAVSRAAREQVPPAARTARATVWTASRSIAEKRVVVGWSRTSVPKWARQAAHSTTGPAAPRGSSGTPRTVKRRRPVQAPVVAVAAAAGAEELAVADGCPTTGADAARMRTRLSAARRPSRPVLAARRTPP